MVPDLLELSGMDVEVALEYCREYNIETSYALECFVSKVIMSPPTSPQDTHWARQIRLAMKKMDDKVVSKCLRNVLMKIHPLDYERIRFVCTWLIDAAEGEDEDALEDNVVTGLGRIDEEELAGISFTGINIDI
jgi:hypothetical protein